MPQTPRDLDVVLFGATGFVGELTAAHLRDHAPEGLRVALAGRSRAKLDSVADRLGGAAAGWERVVIDAGDGAAWDELAARTKVVATTVGPYVRYGREVVRACAEAGTHYCDLTGELLFVRDAADAFHEVAQSTGAKIVPSCGFDSIPSDLGVLATAEAAKERGHGELLSTTLFVRRLKGGLSGGTIDSMRQQAIMAREDKVARRAVADPYGLSPDRSAEPSGREGLPADTPPRPSGPLAKITKALPVRRADDGSWTGPFVMASYNTRVVRRSNALLGYAYGRGFRYQEVTDFGRSLKAPVMATGMTAGLLGLVAGMSFGPTRTLLDKALPAPGEGPSAEDRAKGRFAMEVVAQTTSGTEVRTTVAAPYDPGYNGTAIMLGQATLSLAGDELDGEGGVLTPAVALGDHLIARLRRFGFTIETA
ncbi:saccharopine dehydrogenase NADP-binding domain-containing protein [Janibacter sp. YIM B02568]|uniref:saccharopine dehydrogenase family protein n=1 Tax=Janibacter endophyticus TaxID=2806261 RepID=UPI00194DF5FB|nr:saccharopine dehydrogenase NADP-binding domain-containing protein [Janibacter endophyticus]MBM6544774.1 saccharopine dehydrogenase NADP-binding domain-containing protein [Janibacter endophyticus]